MTSLNMLIEVLSDLYKSQVEMLELAKHKKQVLVNGDIDELNKIIQREASWIKMISKLEDDRMLVVQQFIHEEGYSSVEMTMFDLINVLKSPTEKEQLLNLQRKLSDTISEIHQLNDLNTELIEQSLNYISHSIELVTAEPKQSYTYSNPSMKNTSGSRRGIFDKKA